MKKTLAILLCLVLLLGCCAAGAETAEKTYLATVDMNGAFQLQCALPEGYEIEEIESTDATYIAMFKADESHPLLTLSIAYNELYSDVFRMNDLDAETLARIEESFRSEDDVEISYTETAYGTRLMMIREAEGPVNYVDFYAVYLGYEIEIVVAAQDEAGLTDAQIQMAVDFLSELDFVAPEDDFAPQPEASKAFDGVWQCGRATIAMYWEEEGFRVLIRWGSSAWEHTEWEYSCYYYEEDNTLVSVPFGIRTEYVYGEDGELVSATEAYNDGTATFLLDEEGYLIWQDEKENAGEGMRFEKIPEEPAALSFATIGDAMASEGYTGIAAGDDEHYVAVVALDGAYLRVVADVDDEARRLSGATLEYMDADALEAAFAAYNAYIETLPVAYEEEITAQPKPQEELDALAGKTLLEVEEAGYEFSSSEMSEDDAAIYTVCFGLYDYDLLLKETYTEYMEHDANGFIGDLTVKSACFSGLSRNAAELRYHADGAVEEENDPWSEYSAFAERLVSALSSGRPEDAMQALTDAFSSPRPQEEEPFYIAPISDEIFARIDGKSFKEDCTLPREDLRYLHVLHVDLNGETREGEMIVNYHIAEDVLDILRQLYEAKYPIEKIRLVDEYDADDELSMEDNNSSAFNFRFISHTTRVSKHGLGLAVDINTLYNPYTKIVDGERIVEPITGEPYLDREANFPCKIDHEDLCYQLFTAHGFEWGGDWEDRKDYQHFEIPTDVINEWYPENQ